MHRSCVHSKTQAGSHETGCIVLAVLAVAAAVFATLSLHRARQAEHLLARTSSLVPGQYLSTTNESLPIILRLAHLFLFWRPVAV
jgi:hypothetical protein